MSPLFKSKVCPRTYRGKGSILIAVLALTALVSFILLEFMEEATAKIKYYGLFYNRDDLRTEAYSVLETTMAVIDEIREIDNALHSPTQGWGDPLRYSQVTFDPSLDIDIRISDETAKFSMAQADPLLFNMIFEEMGISLQEAETLTDSLLDWVDEDDLERLNGAESDYYEDGEDGYKPPNEPLQSWEELRLIQGFDTLFFDEEGRPTEYFNQFKNSISLYHSSPVNLNSAGSFVLTVLARLSGFDKEALDTYISGSDGERGTPDDRLINSREHPFFPTGMAGSGGLADLQSQVLKVEVDVKRGESSFLLTTIASWTGANPSASTEQMYVETVYSADGKIIGGRPKKGTTKVKANAGATLGYPFKVQRITENFKI